MQAEEKVPIVRAMRADLIVVNERESEHDTLLEPDNSGHAGSPSPPVSYELAMAGVGFWGCMVLCVNTMNGPGLLAIPEVYQSAGWLFPSLCLVLVAWVAGVTGDCVDAAMAFAKAGLPDRGVDTTSPVFVWNDSPHLSASRNRKEALEAATLRQLANDTESGNVREEPEVKLAESPGAPGAVNPESPKHVRVVIDGRDETQSPAGTPPGPRKIPRDSPSGHHTPPRRQDPYSPKPRRGPRAFPGSPRRGPRTPRSQMESAPGSRFAGLSLAMSMVSTRYEMIRENPEETYEFVSLCGTYFGKIAERVTCAMLIPCLLTLGLAQMIIGCQVIDSLIIWAGGRSYALCYAAGAGQEPGIVHATELSLTPFGSGFWGISLGFIIVCPVCMLLGRMDLSANIMPQIISFMLLCFALCTFFWHFASPHHDPLEPSRVPVVDKGGLAGFLGTVVFNYSFVISVPSLVNEKRDGVDMAKAVWGSTVFMTIVYLTTGVLGAMAFQINHTNVMQDLLYPAAPVVTKLAVFGYTMAIIPAIPIYGILLQYNLEQQRLLTGWKAYMVGNGLPWLTVMVFMYQPMFNTLVNWTSLLVNGFVNFSIPLAVFLKASFVYDNERWPFSEREWFSWALTRAWKRESAKVTSAVAALLIVTVLLVFTIIVNLIYLFVLDDDLLNVIEAKASH